MRVSKEKMAENRAIILDAASRLFRERGFDDVSVAEVMGAAGLTHGAFYGHFRSKDDLIAWALQKSLGKVSAKSSRSIDEYAECYLSRKHRDSVGEGCVFAALSSEAARSTLQARKALTEVLKEQLDSLSERAGAASPEAKRQEAVTAWATMVGALILSRVVADEALSNEILDRTKADLVRPPSE